eukprot:Clim_evm22s235 gene=Clim_evmTU22s235
MTDVFKQDVLKGKVALITGGGTGIGFGIATEFAKHGATIFLMGRRANVLEEACVKLRQLGARAEPIQGDVTNPDTCDKNVQEVVSRGGRLDILVNNAAGNFTTTADKLSQGGFKRVLDIDLVGSFNMSKAAHEALKTSGNGVIINITATLQYKATPFQLHAASAKAGIDVMTQTLAIEWGGDNIRVVGIAPGPIANTEGGPGGRVFGMGSGPMAALMQAALPGTGEVYDIGNTALFLATPAARFITGTTIVVDGGHWHGSAPFYNMAKGAIEQKSAAERSSRKENKSKL